MPQSPGLASPLSSDHSSSTVSQKRRRVRAWSLCSQGPNACRPRNAGLSPVTCLRARGHQELLAAQAWQRLRPSPILCLHVCPLCLWPPRPPRSQPVSSFPNRENTSGKECCLETLYASAGQVAGTPRGGSMSHHPCPCPSMNPARLSQVLPYLISSSLSWASL